jgi:hypothetical protein
MILFNVDFAQRFNDCARSRDGGRRISFYGKESPIEFDPHRRDVPCPNNGIETSAGRSCSTSHNMSTLPIRQSMSGKGSIDFCTTTQPFR